MCHLLGYVEGDPHAKTLFHQFTIHKTISGVTVRVFTQATVG
jgi:hypothetical protein